MTDTFSKEEYIKELERKLKERNELIIEIVKEIDINHIRLNRELDAKVALVMAEN